ncbi:MAG: RNase adaptor protein RapZ, partial [Acidiphilium sp. 21-66-27]
MRDQPSRLIVVTGLSGAGRNSGLRALEDIGYEAVDNPPLAIVETLARVDRPLAVGI